MINGTVEGGRRVKERMPIASRLWRALCIERAAWRDILHHGLPNAVQLPCGGLGDELLLTAVARELIKRRGTLRIWQVANAPDLFVHNGDFTRVFDKSHWQLGYAPSLRRLRVPAQSVTLRSDGTGDVPPSEHLIASLCRKAGIRGRIDLRPYFHLTDIERTAGRHAAFQVVVQCVGEGSHGHVMRNKLWDANRFQRVVDALRSTYPGATIIQLGDGKHPLMRGTLDLRAKTSLRESASILGASSCFIGTVGFLMHLARAVECRSVIIYGGREHAWQSGYPCNENLQSSAPCAPCWLYHKCEYQHRCMKEIEVDHVVAATARILENREQLLDTEWISLAAITRRCS